MSRQYTIKCTESFANRLVNVEKMIKTRPVASHPNRSDTEVPKEVAIGLGVFCHDDNQLIDASEKMGAQIDPRFRKVKKPLDGVENCLATVPERF